MKRSPLLRKAELRSKYRTHKDPVTPELRNYVLARDAGCVMPRLDFAPRPADNIPPDEILPLPFCDGRIEIDHVDNGGIGKRGPSTPANLVSLCGPHHRFKTENSRLMRSLLRAYLARVER